MKTPVATVVKRCPGPKHVAKAARVELRRLLTPVAVLVMMWMASSLLSLH